MTSEFVRSYNNLKKWNGSVTTHKNIILLVEPRTVVNQNGRGNNKIKINK